MEKAPENSRTPLPDLDRPEQRDAINKALQSLVEKLTEQEIKTKKKEKET
jgi:hypothetical protein